MSSVEDSLFGVLPISSYFGVDDHVLLFQMRLDVKSNVWTRGTLQIDLETGKVEGEGVGVEK